ncbi:formate--tetrahydrofolate ligase [Gammaproteobacteria bacterium]|nr:formate--tetrahydrofolate ligase [Gammaproteobacteria bacterium]
MNKFAVPVAVAINEFYTDTRNEHQAIIDFCKNLGVVCKVSSHWSDGGKGAAGLAEYVAELADGNQNSFKKLYDDDLSLWKKRNISQLVFMELMILLQIKK